MGFVVFFSLLVFVGRGPARTLLGSSGDFAAPYVGSLRLRLGQNPYPQAGFLSEFHGAGAPSDSRVDDSGTRPIYPPTALFLLQPVTYLRWRGATELFVFLSCFLYFLTIFFAARMISADWFSWRRMGLVAFGLALAPPQTAIALGNLSSITVCLCLLSVIMLWTDFEILAGVLLCIALLLKPSSGPLILLLMFFCKNWRALGAFAVTALPVGLLTLHRMASLPAVWRADYQSNVSYLFGPLGAASFYSGSWDRFDDLNLQVPFYILFPKTALANGLAWLVVGMLGVGWLRCVLRERSGGRLPLAAYASLLLIGLLPVYQRNYNAGVILLALVWAFQGIERRLERTVLCLCCVFLLPWEAILRREVIHAPFWLVNSQLLQAFVLCAANWALVVMAVLLLRSMARWIPGQPGAGESMVSPRTASFGSLFGM